MSAHTFCVRRDHADDDIDRDDQCFWIIASAAVWLRLPLIDRRGHEGAVAAIGVIQQRPLESRRGPLRALTVVRAGDCLSELASGVKAVLLCVLVVVGGCCVRGRRPVMDDRA
jgi:hypothetical protein